jgi:hypothetical protein
MSHLFIYTCKAEFAGFEVLTAVTMKCIIFWDVTVCSPLEIHAELEECTASIFRVKEKAKKPMSKKYLEP